jgi:hypothetical protein
MAELGPRKLRSIQPIDLERARVDLLHSGRLKARSPSAVNQFIAWLRHVLTIEVRQGRLPTNPVTTVEPFKEPPAATAYIDEALEARMSTALGPYAGWARLAILLGLRQTEQFSPCNGTGLISMPVWGSYPSRRVGNPSPSSLPMKPSRFFGGSRPMAGRRSCSLLQSIQSVRSMGRTGTM